MNIVEALRDPRLFGASPAFGDPGTWGPWVTFLKATYGLPLEPGEIELFQQCTGRDRYDPPQGGWPEVACIVGRQAGKTRISALIIGYESAFAPETRDGEVYALLLAQEWRASIRASFSYVRSIFDASPILRGTIENEKRDTLALSNGTRVATYPCRPASIRGLRARVVLLDPRIHYPPQRVSYP
jgi:hypothetical protein